MACKQKPKLKRKLRPWEGFSNKTMRVIFPDRPHVAFIRGWWRVSPLPKGPDVNKDLWFEAHTVANYLNNQRLSK